MKGWSLAHLALVLFQTRASAHLLARNGGASSGTTTPPPAATSSQTLGRTDCVGSPFTCPSNSKCVITTPDNSTVLCCQTGNDCSTIAPIVCDIQQQNATAFPNSSLFTTQLDTNLASCGSQTCCPNGYVCGSDTMCTLAQKTPSSTLSPSAKPSATGSMTPSPTGTEIPVIVPTSSTDANATGSQTSRSSSNYFPARAVVLGLAIGLTIGVAATVLVFWFLRRRREQKRQALPSPDFMGKTPPSISPVNKPIKATQAQHQHSGSAGSTVHEPMWANAFDTTHRTDILRRGDSKTGYEHQVKPSWSSNDSGASTATTNSTSKAKVEQATPVTVQRVRSKRVNNNSLAAPSSGAQNPYTPPHQTDTASGKKPMFENATRFGLPITPTPASRNKQKPQRPLRSDEFVPTMSGGLVSSKNTGGRIRDDSQTRPLVQHDVLTRAQEEHARQAQDLQRSDTFHSTISAASSKASSGEVMTIHLDTPGSKPSAYLASPAPLFATRDEHDRPQTTFTDLMVRAGWKEGDGWHTTTMPNRR